VQFRRPPKHGADDPIIYIHPSDEAWDEQAISDTSDDEGVDDDPFIEYCSGRTRFSPVGVQHLLSGNPVEFHLRRLSAIELTEVASLMERDHAQGSTSYRTAYLQAARYGLTAVKQSGMDLVRLQSPGALSADDIEVLSSTSMGIELIRCVGQAVHIASQPLRDDEKKR
jgi:hypothetical protein